jgi:hypothetical protein
MTEVRFVPQNMPVVDKRGIMSNAWYLFFQSFFDPQSISGEQDSILSSIPLPSVDASIAVSQAIQALGQSPVANDVQVSQFDQAPAVPLFFAAEDVIPIVSSLRDEIGELRKALNDITQGGVFQ